jgi:Bacterial PH domain
VTPGVDFFRVDRSASTTRLLIISAVLIALGACAVGAHSMHWLTPQQGRIVSVAGGVVMLAGLVTGFATLAMMLFEDLYLAIKDEGLLVHDNGREVAVPWDELAGVDFDAARGAIALRRKDGEPLVFHAGGAAEDMARRITEARRKGAYGLPTTS